MRPTCSGSIDRVLFTMIVIYQVLSRNMVQILNFGGCVIVAMCTNSRTYAPTLCPVWPNAFSTMAFLAKSFCHTLLEGIL